MLIFDVYDITRGSDLTLIKTKQLHTNVLQGQTLGRYVTMLTKQYEKRSMVHLAAQKLHLRAINANGPRCASMDVNQMAIGLILLGNTVFKSRRVNMISNVVLQIMSNSRVIPIYQDTFEIAMLAFAVTRACANVCTYADDCDIFYMPCTTDLPKHMYVDSVIYAMLDNQNMAVTTKISRVQPINALPNNFIPFAPLQFVNDMQPLALRNMLEKSKVPYAAKYLEQHIMHASAPAIKMLDLGRKAYQLFFESFANIDLSAIKLDQPDVMPGWIQVKMAMKDNIQPQAAMAFRNIQKEISDCRRVIAVELVKKAYEYGILLSPIIDGHIEYVKEGEACPTC